MYNKKRIYERKKERFLVLVLMEKKTWAETAEIKGHKSSNVIKMDGVICGASRNE